MTLERLDTIKARHDAGLPDDIWPEDGRVSNADMLKALAKTNKHISQDRRDIAALITEVEHLTRKCDAAIADLREAISTVCDDECRFCKHGNSTECAICNIDVGSKWEWRRVRETVNG